MLCPGTNPTAPSFNGTMATKPSSKSAASRGCQRLQLLRGTAAAVTGGGGYVGTVLARCLLEHGCSVRRLDVSFPPQFANNATDWPSGASPPECMVCDVTSYEDVLKGLRGIDTVVHLASYGMSGVGQLNEKRVREVNVAGTQNVGLRQTHRSGSLQNHRALCQTKSPPSPPP